MPDTGDRVSTLEAQARADGIEIARIKTEIGEMRKDVAELLYIARTGYGLWRTILGLGGLAAALTAAWHYGITDWRGP